MQQALAQWMEYLLREFVVSWYSLSIKAFKHPQQLLQQTLEEETDNAEKFMNSMAIPIASSIKFFRACTPLECHTLVQ